MNKIVYNNNNVEEVIVQMITPNSYFQGKLVQEEERASNLEIELNKTEFDLVKIKEDVKLFSKLKVILKENKIKRLSKEYCQSRFMCRNYWELA